MSYLPESASFEERVQDYFLSLRGSGLMLGALDGELLSHWAAAEVPFEVVARGIRRAADRAAWDARPGEPILRSLRSCRREVETEVQRHRRLGAGRGVVPAGIHPIAALRAPLHPVDGEELTARDSTVDSGYGHRARGAELRRARVLFESLSASHPAVFARASALLDQAEAIDPSELLALLDREDRLVASLLRCLPFAVRLELLRTARDLVKAASPVSAGARRWSLRFHRSAVLRRHLGLPPS